MYLNPKYPVYIISKGRWESRQTVRAFDKIGLPYRIVVEPQEYDNYAAVIPLERILVLPFSNLGLGSIPARNWVWEHSIQEGHKRHWIVDDNIRAFYRFNRNLKIEVTSGNIFAAMEDFTDRYTNAPMAGPNYHMFVARKEGNRPPFIPNSRVYSCILLSNEVKHRWRGRYNEDTDLALRFLKDGFCTILFNAFLAEKSVTMTVKGGNTDELYRQDQTFDGRLAMAQSLHEQHPDVTTITRKWGRWQHRVNYLPFKSNLLIKQKEAVIQEGVNNYGMSLAPWSKQEREASNKTASPD